MKNCGTCQYSEMRSDGIGLCHHQDADKYAEEVDYHEEKCDNFEQLSNMFSSEIWD